MLRSTSSLGLLALSACQPEKLPGVQVGAYQVLGTLQENSCGADALPAESPLTFAVEVRRSGTAGLWILNDGVGAAEGSLDDSGNFSFIQLSQHQAIPPHQERVEEDELTRYWGQLPASVSDPGCVLATEERVSGRLDLEPPAPDASSSYPLVGRNEIRVYALSGSNCLPVLAIAGGPFQELPCVASYELTGEQL